MDKDHLVDLISNSIMDNRKDPEAKRSLCEFQNYLKQLNLEQLRTMSKEFIL